MFSLVERRLQDTSWNTFRYRQMWMHTFDKFCIDAWRRSKWCQSNVFKNHHLDWMWDIFSWTITHDTNFYCFQVSCEGSFDIFVVTFIRFSILCGRLFYGSYRFVTSSIISLNILILFLPWASCRACIWPADYVMLN